MAQGNAREIGNRMKSSIDKYDSIKSPCHIESHCCCENPIISWHPSAFEATKNVWPRFFEAFRIAFNMNPHPHITCVTCCESARNYRLLQNRAWRALQPILPDDDTCNGYFLYDPMDSNAATQSVNQFTSYAKSSFLCAFGRFSYQTYARKTFKSEMTQNLSFRNLFSNGKISLDFVDFFFALGFEMPMSR